MLEQGEGEGEGGAASGGVRVVDPDQEVTEGAGHDLRLGQRARALQPDLEDAVGMADHLRERVGRTPDRPEFLDHKSVLEPDSLDPHGRERGQPDLEPPPPDARVSRSRFPSRSTDSITPPAARWWNPQKPAQADERHLWKIATSSPSMVVKTRRQVERGMALIATNRAP